MKGSASRGFSLDRVPKAVRQEEQTLPKAAVVPRPAPSLEASPPPNGLANRPRLAYALVFLACGSMLLTRYRTRSDVNGDLWHESLSRPAEWLGMRTTP